MWELSPHEIWFCPFFNICMHLSFHSSPNSIWKLITPFDANIGWFLGIGVTTACDDVIFYVILKQEGQDGPKSLTWV